MLNENHENSKHQKPNLKQIPMTQIQNSKKMIRYGCSQCHHCWQTMVCRAIQYEWGICFWSLIIEIWCLRVGILLFYKTY
jgi:hypothetical protein